MLRNPSPHLLLLVFLVTTVGLGCFGMRPAPTPMPSRFSPAALPPTQEHARGLVVFLPGMGDRPERYEEKGFVERVRRANPHFDVIAADAHFGYFRNFRVLDRLHLDVIAPIADRYERIWIVGISMGGLVATTYAMEYPDRVEGALVLAPFLGSRAVVQEVMDAGGLEHWQAPEQVDDYGPRTRLYYRLWTWLGSRLDPNYRGPRLLIGVGDRDRLRDPGRLFGAHIAEHDYIERPGGHDWDAWTALFDVLIERAIGKSSGLRFTKAD